MSAKQIATCMKKVCTYSDRKNTDYLANLPERAVE